MAEKAGISVPTEHIRTMSTAEVLRYWGPAPSRVALRVRRLRWLQHVTGEPRRPLALLGAL
eukprot:5750792-Pyramimonas_sp.AAC.1